MKKILLALVIGLFSVSAFAAHHEGKGGKHKTAAHKKHKQHKKSKQKH